MQCAIEKDRFVRKKEEAESTITGRSNKATVDPYINSASGGIITNPDESVKSENSPTEKGKVTADSPDAIRSQYDATLERRTTEATTASSE